jgi:polysaccharide export outer membrane protein
MTSRFVLIAVCTLLSNLLSAAELPLQAGDRINLNIGGVRAEDAEQIRGVYTISDAGTINLAFLKQVKAAGLKPSALQTEIENAFVKEGYFTKPTITIAVDDKITERFVYVISGCQQNGPVSYTSGMKIMMAISGARGFSPFAKPSKTQVLRAGKVIHIDLGKPGPAMETELQPGDQIIVKE